MLHILHRAFFHLAIESHVCEVFGSGDTKVTTHHIVAHLSAHGISWTTEVISSVAHFSSCTDTNVCAGFELAYDLLHCLIG
jgi:hypothetical protein